MAEMYCTQSGDYVGPNIYARSWDEAAGIAEALGVELLGVLKVVYYG